MNPKDNKQNKTTNNPIRQATTLIEAHKGIRPIRESLIIVLWYSVFGFSWIAITDSALQWLVSDPIQAQRIQLIKGWVFIVLTVLIIFVIVRKRIEMIQAFVEGMTAASLVIDSAEEALLIQKAVTEEIIGKAPVMIIIWNTDGSLKSVNPYTLEVFGIKVNNSTEQIWQDFESVNKNLDIIKVVFETLKQEERLINFEVELATLDGQKIYTTWNSGVLTKKNGESNEYVSFGVDVTAKKIATDRLQELAFTDAMTGLPNRVSLEQYIQTRLDQVGTRLALLYIDVDNFKYVNDSLGHNVGDELLKYLSNCLLKAVGPGNFVARLGGDEFANVIDQFIDHNQVTTIVEKIKQETGKTWHIYNHSFYISLSIGVAISGDHGNDFHTLSKNADIAMYSAKNEGKDRVMFFAETIEQNSLYHMDMAKRIQKAIENSCFELYYQPQYRLEDRIIIGFEALIRWNEPTRGFISPAEFIPLAEETGQIYAIERWVFQAALTQKMRWNDDGHEQLTLSINLSSKTLISDLHFSTIEAAITEYKGDLSKITIEITETALISDIEKVLLRVHRLKNLGVKIALDDFGTGYSSLTHIKLLPIDIIKLDRSFISQIENKGKDEMIISSVISLVKKLGFKLVAEGIENQAQYDYLVGNGCEFGQGFLMSRPLDIQKANLYISTTAK